MQFHDDRKPKKDQSDKQISNPRFGNSEVSGSDLLQAIVALLKRHLSLPEGAADAIALWVLFTWNHNAFDHSPRLAVQSPLPACGKTTMVRILSGLVPNPLATSDTSSAAIFRMIKDDPRTFLIDEIDTKIHVDPDLLRILNSGHSRATATVVRCVGEAYKATEFPTWAPFVLSGIGELPEALQSRSIIIPLQRAMPDEDIAQFTSEAEKRLAILRSHAEVWTRSRMERLRHADPEMPEGFDGRLADNWRPLFAIADNVGGEWSDRARAAAVELQAQSEAPEALKTLDAAYKVVLDRNEETIPSSDLFKAIRASNGEGISILDSSDDYFSSMKGMANHLRAFGIKPRVLKIDGKSVRGYERKDFENAAKRYLRRRLKGNEA